MELLANLAHGFGVALSPSTLLYCLIGVTFGTFIGVLPGIGPLATIGLLLPITFHLPPIEGIVMLAGIYYGAMYGGSTTAILLNLPGTAASLMAALDGHPMAKQGRAGPALVMTTLVSFFSACVAILLIAAFAPPLARFALNFGSPEYFSLMVMGLIAASVLVSGSIIKGLAMMVFGLLMGMVGLDLTTGAPRYTFGVASLYEGLSFVIVIIGLFGLAEVINNLALGERRQSFTGRVPWRDLIPTRKDLKDARFSTLRGTLLGAALGILPGAGPAISTFAAYALEKRVAKDPSRFGKGAMEGLTAPEAANNAAAQTSFIPTLSLGIPGDATMAIMLGAMLIHGLVPGPQIVTENPDFFWGLIASFWIGNLFLLILNLPLVGIWVKMLSMPYSWMFPAILSFIGIGMYSLHLDSFDVYLTVGFGLLGFLLLKLRCEAAPLLLGLVLAPLLEDNLRRSLLLSRGDPMIFIERPISLFFVMLGAGFLLLVAVPSVLRWFRSRRGPAPDGAGK
ncbi:tripartite tricarboxylate transporter permease [Alkalilacustris brevis]|uniref:tripartite tricarboxylate transporter permease n=1 Tax=Alkalilacustris brevis TaxID=2026338 RepID=UPI000E0CCEA2|nr:tripartite tricarboxylate transporter permease [Alkalilacustris brevis]